MPNSSFARKLTLLIGDVLVIYLALAIALLVRGGSFMLQSGWADHFWPFSAVGVGFVLSFYLAGLYDLRQMRGGVEILKILTLALTVGSLLAVVFFYFIPYFGISPKTNLFLFIFCFGLLELFWRRLSIFHFLKTTSPYQVLLVGDNPTVKSIASTLKDSPQLGYSLADWLTTENNPNSWASLMLNKKANLLAVPRHLRQNSQSAGSLYQLLAHGITIRDTSYLYESIFQKIPLADLDESWFLENLSDHQRYYDQLKSAGEFAMALALQIFFLPIQIIIALLVLATSSGPIIYRQIRIGQNGKHFVLYKFRSMYDDKNKNPDADSSAPQWSQPNDSRVTPFGKFLRASHLDELPQLWNILKGDLSFIGPRAERPEFVDSLSKVLPYYNVRHLVKPGLSGWAQVNFPYGASVEDSARKLEYDIYYLKNRSLPLDLAIALRTIKFFFVNHPSSSKK